MKEKNLEEIEELKDINRKFISGDVLSDKEIKMLIVLYTETKAALYCLSEWHKLSYLDVSKRLETLISWNRERIERKPITKKHGVWFH